MGGSQPAKCEMASVTNSAIREASDLLSTEECESVIAMARGRLRPCAPVVGPVRADLAPGTSGLACIRRQDPFPEEVAGILAYLRTLIAELSGLPESHQEPFQIVHHPECGPLAKEAGIGFPGWEYLKWQTDRGGERVFCFVLHLNDVASGGETERVPHGNRVRPEAGKAAFWGDGLVASHPLEKGEKWLLTCWVRQSAFPSPSADEIERIVRGGGWNFDALDGAAASEASDAPDWIVEQTCRQQDRTPYLGAGGSGCRGFEKRVLDEADFDYIRARYEAILHRLSPERGDAIGAHLQTVSREAPPCLFVEDRSFNHGLLERLRPLHEAWCGLELEPSACYGFRVYLPGAYLHDHVDTGTTHIVSSTLCVDRDLRAPWPLHAVDIDGREQEVDLEPGELLLYESARIAHGRPTPLRGRFHVGIFIHYRPVASWEGWKSFSAGRRAP